MAFLKNCKSFFWFTQDCEGLGEAIADRNSVLKGIVLPK